MGHFKQDLTVVFETTEDMKDWLDFLDFHSKRLKCRPEEVISKLVAEWKKTGMTIEELQILPPKIPEKKSRKKKDGSPSDLLRNDQH